MYVFKNIDLDNDTANIPNRNNSDGNTNYFCIATAISTATTNSIVQAYTGQGTSCPIYAQKHHAENTS
jgi:hypothetical protein